jgi:7,8-dihydroneopterin aldolase/epimerase/oxygenase
MLTISLHGISIHAKIGLYPEEKINGNDFEVDVDIDVATEQEQPFPFVDYAVVHQLVLQEFAGEGELLETFVKKIHTAVKDAFPESGRVKVAIRKLAPPLGTPVRYSQVSYDG